MNDDACSAKGFYWDCLDDYCRGNDNVNADYAVICPEAYASPRSRAARSSRDQLSTQLSYVGIIYLMLMNAS